MFKFLIIIGAIIVVAFIFVPKEYGESGGLAGLPLNNDCSCLGIKYTKYPEGVADAFTTHVCAGITFSCTE